MRRLRGVILEGEEIEGGHSQGQIYILFRAPGRPSEWKTRRQNGNSRQNLARMVPGLEL